VSGPSCSIISGASRCDGRSADVILTSVVCQAAGLLLSAVRECPTLSG